MKKTYIQVGNGTKVDIKAVYGAYFASSAVSSLMSPAPMKDSDENDSRLQHGVRDIDGVDDAKYGKKELSLELNMSAYTEEEFLLNYHSFCDDILAKRYFTITTDYVPGVFYRVRYDNCSQFSEFRQQLAKFMLKLTELDPTNRAEVDYHLTENS